MKRILIRTVAIAITIAILLGLNALATRLELDPSYHAGYVIRILMLALINVIAAVSLNLVNGLTGQFSLGHAVFFGIGAYTGASLTVYGQKFFFGHILGSSETVGWLHGGVVLLAAMLFGGAMAALAGFVVGLPSLKLRGDYLAIVTLGFNQIVVVVIQNLNIVGGAAGFTGCYTRNGFVGIPGLTSFFWVSIVAVAVIALSINIRRSVHGLAFESIREDEVAAEAMGVPTTKYKVTAFVLAAFLAGIAGVLYVHYNQSVAPPNMDFISSINFVVMIVLGGLGSVTGAVIGAVLLTVLPEALRIEPTYRLVIYSITLIVLMLVRPQGIFGRDELGRLWVKKQIRGCATLPARTSAWLAGTFHRLLRRRMSA